MLDPMIKDILEGGVLLVMTSIFLKQQQKMFGYQEQMITTLAKLEKNLNSDQVRGKGLELMLNLKIQELRWSLRNKIIKYIDNNNIVKNWDIIIRELDVTIEEKKLNVYIPLKNLTDSAYLKIVSKALDEELKNTDEVIKMILESLKNSNEMEDYKTAKRSVDTHFERFENHMTQKINDLLN